VRALAATVIALGLVGTAAGTTPKSGLRGVVLIDPAFPVCRDDVPCTKPAKHVWLLFARNGRTVARTRTTDNGSYRIPLAPGTYAVTSPTHTAGKGQGLTPQRVTVRRGRYRRVEFRLDVGIR
jgi:hypothetical protein